jgi:flagellar FliL protein
MFMADDDKAVKKKGGLMPALLIITLVGGGGGYMAGMKMVKKPGQASVAGAVEKPADTKGAAAHGGTAGKSDETAHATPTPDKLKTIDIPAVITNLASPEGVFLRLQLSLVVDKDLPAKLEGGSFSSDLVAWLRTVPLEQLTGVSGLQHLREDIKDRADIKFSGHVHDVILHDLVVQ